MLNAQKRRVSERRGIKSHWTLRKHSNSKGSDFPVVEVQRIKHSPINHAHSSRLPAFSLAWLCGQWDQTLSSVNTLLCICNYVYLCYACYGSVSMILLDMTMYLNYLSGSGQSWILHEMCLSILKHTFLIHHRHDIFVGLFSVLRCRMGWGEA